MEREPQEQAVLDFFKEGKEVSFDQLPTSMITGRVSFNSSAKINQNLLFENLDIYEIPNYQRPKRMKIDLPNPGVPYAILSARIGTRVKGIIKNTKILTEKKKSGKLSERLSFDFTVEDAILNIMVYPNMIKISGGRSRKHLAQAFKFFTALLLMISKRGVNLFDHFPIASQIHLDMVNVHFDLGYAVNKNLMKQSFKENDKLVHLPHEKEELKICYEMGMNKTNGEKRYYIFRVRHSGKIHFTGDDRSKMKKVYEHFMQLIKSHEDSFRFN